MVTLTYFLRSNDAKILNVPFPDDNLLTSDLDLFSEVTLYHLRLYYSWYLEMGNSSYSQTVPSRNGVGHCSCNLITFYYLILS